MKAGRILKYLYSQDHYIERSGDLEEVYAELLEETGPFRAKVWLWFQILKLCLLIARSSVVWRFIMFKNYMVIALRNIKRHKTLSVINIAGAIVGMTCFILILLFVRYELGYDAFHEKADNIYRIYSESQYVEHFGSSHFAGSPGILAQTLMDELPEVRTATSVGKYPNRLIRYRDRTFYENGIHADEHFRDIFTFPLISGDPGKA